MAFCIWDGGYLPTQTEWNYAASGGGEQRAYPWSAPASSLTIDCSHANYVISSATYCVNNPAGAMNRVGSESPIGDGAWGHSDLAGNAWEWVLDWSGPLPTPCADCALLVGGTERVRRGGAFNHDATFQRGALSVTEVPTDRSYVNGIRCARAQ